MIVLAASVGALVAALAALAAALGWVRRNPKPFPERLTPLLESQLRRRFMAPDALAEQLDVRTGMRVLEIGPGGGMLTAELARVARGAAIVCLDIQPSMLARVRSRPDLDRVTLACGSASAMPFRDGSFERVVMVTVLGEVPDRADALRECARVLRPGGVLAIGEAMPDPDFIPRARLVREGMQAGFAPSEHSGSWFSYTQHFVRRG